MEDKFYFTKQELELLLKLYKQLKKLSGDTLHKDDCYKIKKHLAQFVSQGDMPRNVFGMNPIIKDMQTAIIVAEEIGMKRASILSIMLHEPVKYGLCTLEFVQKEYGEDVACIIKGLVKINELNSDIDNFAMMLSPMLDDKKKKLLSKVVNELKKI